MIEISDRFPELVGLCMRLRTDVEYAEGRNVQIATYDAFQLGKPPIGLIPARTELIVEGIFYERSMEYSAVWVVARWGETKVEVGHLLNGEWIDAIREAAMQNSKIDIPTGVPLVNSRYADRCPNLDHAATHLRERGAVVVAGRSD